MQFVTNEEYNRKYGGNGIAEFAGKFSLTPEVRGTCCHRGKDTGELEACPPCGRNTRLKLFECHHPAHASNPRTTEKNCKEVCRDHASVPSPIRFDETNLFPLPRVPGKRFNPSIMAYGDGYLLAFRNGWCGSEIFIGLLDKDFKPTKLVKKLELFHQHQANYGREDPRLFWFAGKLHIAYIGVVGPHDILYTSQLYARLNDDFETEEIFVPQYRQRNYWEKNWQFFEHAGQLYAVYSIAPHRVLKIDGNNAEMVFDTPTRGNWSGGELRGGASPVLVGDEWYCFFHSRVESGKPVYNTGVYTFEDKPPFLVKRLTADPILVANPANTPADQWASVVFPGGAVRVGDKWLVAHGIDDRHTELHWFTQADIERRLVKLDWELPVKASENTHHA